MKAMILAAGLGTRLRPLTLKTPKPLIAVGGIPLIFYNLALLKKHGITDVVINLHYLGDQIKKQLGDGSRFGFNFQYSEEPEILGTGGGIFHARQWLKGSERFLVINGDIITDLDLTAFIASHKAKKVVASLALIPNGTTKPYGELKVDPSGVMASILGEPKSASGLSTFFSGVHIIEESMLNFPTKSDKFCIIRDVYIPLMQQGQQIGGYLSQAYWNDLGTLERLHQTEGELHSLAFSFKSELEALQNLIN